ncbi:MAG: YigZ family protein [Bacteroides sp.]|nr:YigZ family protein [Ruminococcus flavefaciens]MCM1555582.1 YigZ family protein [Bacteroides sp.]
MARSDKQNPPQAPVSVPDDTYLTLAAPAQGLYKEKGSKFLAFAYPVETEQEIKDLIEKLRKEYYDARHHCYAYVLGSRQEVYRANDDGEPSSTAGKPIHGQILSFGLTNVLVVVVRYFGGTKLGTSGLINAYKTATNDALAQAETVEKVVMRAYGLRFPYEQMNQVMRIVKDLRLQVLGQEADSECRMRVSVRLSECVRFEEKFTDARISFVAE